MSVAADQPIRKPEDDVLGRARFARSFAKQVLQIDASEGTVVGVLGPWGSGKTSFVNLARLCWEEAGVKVLDFNPWMFSGTEQLVERFFFELSAQMRLLPGLAGIGRLLGRFGSGLVGLLPTSPWTLLVQWVLRTLASVGLRESAKMLSRRGKITKALKKLEKPVVVVLDDIDRLTTPEIRDIFKLVRLTANFPNIIYVLAFDRERVEKALNEQNISGRDYLEKILQLGFDLPAVPAYVMNEQVNEAIKNVLSDVSNQGPFDRKAWTDVFFEVVRPPIRNMRDVRRYEAAIYGTVRDLGGQVALVDVLALEAIRVFLPDVFRSVHKSVEGLTTTSGEHTHLSQQQLKEQVDRLIEAADDHAGVVRALVERLFPAGQRHIEGDQSHHYGKEWKNRWLRERRVAHEHVLRLYLERVAGEGLQAFTEAEQAWARMADREALNTYLRSLDPERLQDVIYRLEVYEDQFSREHVVPGTVVLLNLPPLPERPRGGMFASEGWIILGRVVYRLVRSLKDPDEIEAAIRKILPQVTTLSSKLELITTGQGQKLISESAVHALKKDWRDQVRSASAEDLAKEHRLFWLLFRYKKEADPTEPLFEIPDSPGVTLALLQSARSEARSQSYGSRFVDRSPRLAWDGLIEMYGDESTLRERTEALRAARLEGSDELLQLANKYLEGWRPRDMDED
ncbi:MAG: P-loop NTPase fold protein [Truepera sp.]|nr:P-loop NTPase fold protein [Truepera sp.]